MPYVHTIPWASHPWSDIFKMSGGDGMDAMAAVEPHGWQPKGNRPDTDGYDLGEWPYWWYAVRGPEDTSKFGRVWKVLEYCEGDVSEFWFSSLEERDRWLCEEAGPESTRQRWVAGVTYGSRDCDRPIPGVPHG